MLIMCICSVTHIIPMMFPIFIALSMMNINGVVLCLSHIQQRWPVRFLSPIRFLARKAKWSARRNFTSVLFSWSHQATGPVRLDTAAYFWFGWIIRRTPQVARAMPLRASYGPRTGIFNVFHILRGPYEARTGPARNPQGCRKAPLRTCKGIDTTILGKNPARASFLAVRGPWLFMISKPVRGP